VGIAFVLMPYKLGPVSEPLLILAGTVAGCFVIGEIVKRVSWLRPCFGLKAMPRKNAMRTVLVISSLHDDCA
jgi:glucan biosynthesis protein C